MQQDRGNTQAHHDASGLSVTPIDSLLCEARLNDLDDFVVYSRLDSAFCSRLLLHHPPCLAARMDAAWFFGLRGILTESAEIPANSARKKCQKTVADVANPYSARFYVLTEIVQITTRLLIYCQ